MICHSHNVHTPWCALPGPPQGQWHHGHTWGKMHVGFDSGEVLDSAVTNGGSQERAPALCAGTSVTTMPSSRTLGCLPGSTILQRVGLLRTALTERLVRQQTRWTASNGNARLSAPHVLLYCYFCALLGRTCLSQRPRDSSAQPCSLASLRISELAGCHRALQPCHQGGGCRSAGQT